MTNTKETRTLKELVKNFNRVWIYLDSEEAATDFIVQAISNGFKWINGDKILPNTSGFLFGIHNDMTISHLPIYFWWLSFQYNKIPGTPPRIDFRKYINNEEDYFCNEPHFSVKCELRLF